MAPIAIATPPSPFHAIDRKNLTARATVSHKSSTFHHAQPPPIAVSGSGLTFTLDDGRVILDGVSGGAAVACLGNGNDEVIEVMTEQAKKMAYAYHQSLGSGPGDELARYLCERGGFEAAAFLNSGECLRELRRGVWTHKWAGSEAMEACIKTARQYWVEKGELERKYIIARFPSYHGNTLGALAVSTVFSATADVIRLATSPAEGTFTNPSSPPPHSTTSPLRLTAAHTVPTNRRKPIRRASPPS